MNECQLPKLNEEEINENDMTNEELQLSADLISKISGYYLRKELKQEHKRKTKSKRRKANSIAKQSRIKNRK